MSLSTLKSYPSSTSLSSYASYVNNEWPLKEGVSNSTDANENNNWRPEKNGNIFKFSFEIYSGSFTYNILRPNRSGLAVGPGFRNNLCGCVLYNKFNKYKQI